MSEDDDAFYKRVLDNSFIGARGTGMSEDRPSYCTACGEEIRRGETYVPHGGEKYHPRCLPKALNHEEQA